MKRIRFLSVILCLVMLLGISAPAYAASTITVDPINIMVGGKVFLPTDADGNDVPVFVYNGTTYAPLRALAEAYGLEVGYNAEKKLATVDGAPSPDFAGSKGTRQALTKRTALSVSPINIEVNGTVFEPRDADGNPVSVFVYNGTTYAPLRALAEAYGLFVGYDNAKKLATVDFEPVSNLLDTLMAEANAARKAELLSPSVFHGFENYLIDDPSTRNLISPEERDLLLSRHEVVSSVTYEQAVSDVDLLFRTLHVCYGAYYYFGKDAFDQAEQEVMTWLNGKNSVSVPELQDTLRKSLDFMVDAHSFVGYDVDMLGGIRYEYHHCLDQVYSKDDEGYYKDQNGTRLEFVSFSDSRVTIEPTLLESGEIVYSPVLFCPETEASNSTITLKDASGKTYTESMTWQVNPQYGFCFEPDYRFLIENDLAYISIRSFQEMDYPELYASFSESGTKVKDCTAIIFDLRNNSGGGGSSMYEWANNFTGEDPILREAHADRYSIFNSPESQSFFAINYISGGKWLPNDIPIFVLVDDYCASSGESALNILKTMDNVLVVGSNSSGYQLGGNAAWIELPNTGIGANIGTQLRFFFDMENVDCIGYTPDLWCPPHTALESVINMLTQYGVTVSKESAAFQKSIEEYIPITPESITLRPEGYNRDIAHNYLFDLPQGTHYIPVYFHGDLTTDFTVVSSAPVFCTAEKSSDGRIKVVLDGYGCAALTVQCGEAEAVFLVYTPFPINDPEITLDWPGPGFYGIKSDDVFGNTINSGTHSLHVLVDGVRTTDFTVTSSAPDGCKVYRSEDGCLMLNAIDPGYYGITVRCGDTERTFVFWGHL